MIDIGKKNITRREAIVEGRIKLKRSVLSAIKRNKVPKGDVLNAARIAGILAAKKTPHIIPLCHPISVEHIDIRFLFEKDSIKIEAVVCAAAKTGVEMEALVATSVAALTIYDMCKPMDKDMIICDMKLVKKTGGKSGVYIRKKVGQKKS